MFNESEFIHVFPMTTIVMHVYKNTTHCDQNMEDFKKKEEHSLETRKQKHRKTEIPTPSKCKQDEKANKHLQCVWMIMSYLCKLEQIDLKLVGYRNEITFCLPQGAVLIIRSHIRHAMHAVWRESDSYFCEKMTPKCVS